MSEEKLYLLVFMKTGPSVILFSSENEWHFKT